MDNSHSGRTLLELDFLVQVDKGQFSHPMNL